MARPVGSCARKRQGVRAWWLGDEEEAPWRVRHAPLGLAWLSKGSSRSEIPCSQGCEGSRKSKRRAWQTAPFMSDRDLGIWQRGHARENDRSTATKPTLFRPLPRLPSLVQLHPSRRIDEPRSGPEARKCHTTPQLWCVVLCGLPARWFGRTGAMFHCSPSASSCGTENNDEFRRDPLPPPVAVALLPAPSHLILVSSLVCNLLPHPIPTPPRLSLPSPNQTHHHAFATSMSTHCNHGDLCPLEHATNHPCPLSCPVRALAARFLLPHLVSLARTEEMPRRLDACMAPVSAHRGHTPHRVRILP